jgi:hypothetical protein
VLPGYLSTHEAVSLAVRDAKCYDCVVRRWIVPVVVIGIVLSAVVLVLVPFGHQVDARVRDIGGVMIDPYPDGPPGPKFLRGDVPDRSVGLSVRADRAVRPRTRCPTRCGRD